MTYWRLYYHFTWSTKHRLNHIDPRFEQDLYRVIIAKTKAIGAIPYAIGGTENHIHLAASISPNQFLPSFVGQVKGNSAHFINYVIKPDFHFDWQNEYGVVSFGSSNLDKVVEYVRHQKAHHSENRIYRNLEPREKD